MSETSRCIACRLPMRWCICDAMQPKHSLKTKLTLLVHQIEWRKSSNTGHLIREAFQDQRVLVQGRKHHILGDKDFSWGDHKPYILFPGRGARPLSQIPEEDKAHGIHLIIPDGNWRQASSMIKRMAPLANIPTVMLDGEAPLHRRMRMNLSPERMSTFEAIVLALHQFDETMTPETTDKLLHIFRLYADRMLMMRGKLKLGQTELPRETPLPCQDDLLL